MRLFLSAAVLTLSFAAPAQVNAVNNQIDFFEISEVKIVEVNADNNLVEIPQADASEIAHFTKKGNSKNIGEALVVTRDLIAFGQEIYSIIDAGKPVTSYGEVTPVSVLPKNELGVAIDPMDLEYWKEPKSKTFRVVAKNGFGMTMVGFDFMVIFSYGGKYNGKGNYITGAEVAAKDVTVGWGYELNASFKLKSIFNTGSKEDPVAATVIEITYVMKTVLKEKLSKKKFMVNGLGKIKVY